MESTGEHIMDFYNVDAVTGAVLSRLVGLIRYSYGNYEVHPRDTNDMDVAQGPPGTTDDGGSESTIVSASGTFTMEGLDESLLTDDDKTAIKVKC